MGPDIVDVSIYLQVGTVDLLHNFVFEILLSSLVRAWHFGWKAFTDCKNPLKSFLSINYKVTKYV